MTEDSSDLENPVPEENPDKSNQRRSQQSSRRRRSLRWQIRRQLDKMLRTRRVFRAGFVLLPLAGFIYVSLTNVVLDSDDEISGPISGAGSVVRAGSLTEGDPVTSSQTNVKPSSSGASPAVASARHTQPADALASNTMSMDVPADDAQPIDDEITSDDQPAFSVMQLASKWPIDDIGTTELSLSGAAVTGEEPGEQEVSDADAGGSSLEKTTLYEVNEGGSLWRTGKRFINDEVLLDKLIDTLAESGMDVRRVKPGVEFVVHDLGNDGLRVIVDNGGETYESRIVKDIVSTSVQ